MADGVTGNTSVFGTEESRFEPWSANKYEKKGLLPFFSLKHTLTDIVFQ